MIDELTLNRSVATLRVQLRNTRIATTNKIRVEHEARAQRNLEAVAVLDANWELWRHVGGIDPDLLKDTSEEALARVHEARDNLTRLAEAHAEAAGNTVAIADECIALDNNGLAVETN